MSIDDTVELSTEAKALLQAGGGCEAAPTGSRERVLQRLAGTLALSPLAVASVAQAPLSIPAPAPPASGLFASWAAVGLKVKLLVTVLALGGAVGLGLWLPGPARSALQRHAKPPVAATSLLPAASSAPALAPAASPLDSAAPPAPGPTSVVPGPAPSGASAEPPSSSSLAEERALLDSARVALAAGNGRAALQTLSKHEQRFPRGRLVEERESLVVQALAHTAGPAATRQRFAAFRRRFPKSIFLPALQAVVDSSR